MKGFSKYLLCLSVLVVGSCTNLTGNKSRAKNTGTTLESYAEDLSSVRPQTEWVEPKEEEVKLPIQVKESTKTSEPPKSENAKIDAALNEIAKYSQAITTASGYRIQIFSGNSRQDFNAAKSYILQYFPELYIYESYTQPTYRIKVGDFIRRIDAEKYYSNLHGRFTSAKITSEAINVQRGFEINK